LKRLIDLTNSNLRTYFVIVTVGDSLWHPSNFPWQSLQVSQICNSRSVLETISVDEVHLSSMQILSFFWNSHVTDFKFIYFTFNTVLFYTFNTVLFYIVSFYNNNVRIWNVFKIFYFIIYNIISHDIWYIYVYIYIYIYMFKIYIIIYNSSLSQYICFTNFLYFLLHTIFLSTLYLYNLYWLYYI